ncbi:MAG: carboxypeptidase-like regulatory domain-containing protein [Sphingobacteriaceae bacterium]|nr:carboxypeptidase-like regulatory domain-containing protein [Sphingobacteriaceae bacterium]MBK7817659.1 carboxypeptidase-like regulatory domain-containing protein [Sphingobacteriaceae bacterium]
MKRLLYILTALTLSLGTFANDDRNGGKEVTKTVFIKVTDSQGEELAGAKVVLAETGKEYITDFNGQIQITIKTTETLTLKVNSLGYNEVTLKSSELNTFTELSLSSL